MATVFRCDRCKKEETYKHSLTSIGGYDFCNRCYKAFMEWTKNFSATTSTSTLDIRKDK